MTGKGVHHAQQCSRKPDPKWKYVAEEKPILDGSFAVAVEDFTFRGEQIKLLSEYADASDASDPAAAEFLRRREGQPPPPQQGRAIPSAIPHVVIGDALDGTTG